MTHLKAALARDSEEIRRIDWIRPSERPGTPAHLRFAFLGSLNTLKAMDRLLKEIGAKTAVTAIAKGGRRPKGLSRRGSTEGRRWTEKVFGGRDLRCCLLWADKIWREAISRLIGGRVHSDNKRERIVHGFAVHFLKIWTKLTFSMLLLQMNSLFTVGKQNPKNSIIWGTKSVHFRQVGKGLRGLCLTAKKASHKMANTWETLHLLVEYSSRQVNF